MTSNTKVLITFLIIAALSLYIYFRRNKIRLGWSFAWMRQMPTLPATSRKILQWFLAIVLLATVIRFWLLQYVPERIPEAPTLESLAINFRRYWLWILEFCGLLVFAISFIPKEDIRKQLMFGVRAVLALFAIAMLWTWFKTGSATVARQTIQEVPSTPNCPNFTFQQTRSCWIDGNWSNWVRSDDGVSSNGMHVCFDHALFEQIERDGVSYIHFKSAVGGRETIKYRLYPPPDYVCPPDFRS